MDLETWKYIKVLNGAIVMCKEHVQRMEKRVEVMQEQVDLLLRRGDEL
jgi:hypothetical protein